MCAASQGGWSSHASRQTIKLMPHVIFSGLSSVKEAVWQIYKICRVKLSVTRKQREASVSLEPPKLSVY